MKEKREKVRALLSDYCLSYVWLAHELAKRGILTNRIELCQFITGSRETSKAEKVLDSSLQILNIYGERYVKT